jgi:hypothetical protein
VADPLTDEVLGLIGSDENVPRLAEVLRGLDDKQRKALFGPVHKHAEATWLNREGQGASAIAVLGFVTGVRQAAARLEWLSIDGDAEAAAVDVITARQPHWLPAALRTGGWPTPGLDSSGVGRCPDCS